MNLGSIRTRLAVSVGVIFGLAAITSAAVMLSQLEHTMLANSEKSANALLDDYTSGLQAGLPGSIDSTSEDRVRFVYTDGSGDEITPDEFGFLLVGAMPIFVDGGNEVLFDVAPGDQLVDITELVDSADLPPTGDEGVVIRTLPLELGERTTEITEDELTVRVHLSIEEQGLSLGVIQPLAEMRQSLAAVRRLLILGIPLLTLFVAAIAWGVVGRSLRPVADMASRVDQISNESLDQRIPEPAATSELGHLARTMNAMLERLESARDSQRRFVSDASHELRSPITATKATIEVARAHPESADWEETSEVLAQENDRLAGLVDDLLLLANLDENPAGPGVSLIDLDEVCLAEASRPHPVPIRVQIDRPARVEANLGRLTRALRNIVDNGSRHAASEVVVRVDAIEGFGIIEVSDDGSGISPEMTDRVFDRFTRLDESRNRAGGGGAGLGLAIARQIVEAAGGTVTATNRGGAVFTIRLPLAA